MVARRRPIDAGAGIVRRRRLDRDPHLDEFGLTDPAALVDARRQAEAIAAGTGVKLGRLIVASSGERGGTAQDIVVTANRRAASLVAPPPIAVEMTPRPIETQAQVTVTREIAS